MLNHSRFLTAFLVLAIGLTAAADVQAGFLCHGCGLGFGRARARVANRVERRRSARASRWEITTYSEYSETKVEPIQAPPAQPYFPPLVK